MKRLLLTLFFVLFLTSNALAGWYYGYSTASGGNPTPFFSESFDGSTLCYTGEASVCNQTWGLVTGTVTFSTGGIAVDGTTATSTARPNAFTAKDTVHGYLLLSVDSYGTSDREIVMFTDSGGVSQLILELSSTGTVRVLCGTSSVYTVGTLSTSTSYHVWFGYTKGTGSNAVGYVAFSTNGVKPLSGDNYASTTTGTSTAQVARFYVKSENVTNGVIATFDKIRLADETFTDNPS